MIHFFIFFLHVQLVLQLELVLGVVLRRPCVFFSLLKLALFLQVLALLRALSLNVSDLVRTQRLEMVRNVTVTSQLGCRRVEVLSHNVGLESVIKLSSVGILLLLGPGGLTVALFLSEFEVLLLGGLH